jgi:hypothetical protein
MKTSIFNVGYLVWCSSVASANIKMKRNKNEENTKVGGNLFMMLNY